MSKRVKTCISCTNGVKKAKVDSKGKSFFQVLEVLTQRGDDIMSPKSAQKRTQTRVSCTNRDRKMTIKSKWSFEVMYSSMKLFSLEILALCFDVIISKCDVKEGLLFHTFLPMFHKNFKILLLSYDLSRFAPIFRKIDEKFPIYKDSFNSM